MERKKSELRRSIRENPPDSGNNPAREGLGTVVNDSQVGSDSGACGVVAVDCSQGDYPLELPGVPPPPAPQSDPFFGARHHFVGRID